MATTLHDDLHDHNLMTDLLGAVLGVAVALLLVLATLAVAGLLVLRWAQDLGA